MTIARIDSILDKSADFLGVNLDSSLYYAYKGLGLSQKYKYDKGFQRSYHVIGTTFLYTANSDSALFYLNKALEYSKKTGDKKGEANAYNNIGYMYDSIDDLDNAIMYYKKAFENYSEIKDTSGIAAYYINMSIIYGRLNDFKSSLEYLIEAHDLAEKVGDSSSAGIAKINIAGKYVNSKDYDKAKKFLQDAAKIFHSKGEYETLAFIYSLYGAMYKDQKKYEKAITYLDSAYVYYTFSKNNYEKNVVLISQAEICIEQKNFPRCISLLKKAQKYKSLLPDDRAAIYYLMGKIDYLKANYSSAKENLRKALTFKLPSDELELPRDIYKLLFEIEKKKNNYKRALGYFETYSKFKDSLKILDAKSEAYNYEKIRELKIKEKELKNLQKEKRIKELELDKQRLIKNYFIVSSILLLVVFVLGAYQFRKIHKLNQSLKKFNNQKEKFLRIISHDIKNSLGAVLNFSELIMTNMEDLSKEELVTSVKEINRAATSTNNLLTNLLEWSLALNDEKEFVLSPNNLKEIINEGISSSVSSRLIKNISCDIEIPNEIVVYADRNSLISVIRNLCTNAIKFSYENSTIKLYAKKLDNFAEVTIEDEGVGMNKEDLETLFSESGKKKSARGTMNEKGTGLGLSLVKTFVENNGGKIRAESEPGKGSKFIFTIPLYNAD